MKRRDFIQASSVAAMGALAFPAALCELKKIGNMGVQLYTVRDNMAKDPIGTLKKVAEIGYTDVELAGYYERKFYGMPPIAFKRLLNELGLTTNSGHVGPDRLREDWEATVADAAILGQKYLVIPWLPESERKTIDQYKRLAEALNRGGEVAKKAGIQLAYHNHDFEFITLDGQVPYDLLLQACDPKLLKMELDLYWIIKAGKDPLAYFNQHAGRFHLWHVKDMDDTSDRFFTEVGNGTIDWSAIFKAARKAGMKHFYVEQDVCKNHAPLESIAISYKYLQGLRY